MDVFGVETTVRLRGLRTFDLGLRAKGIPCAETRMRQTHGSAGTPRPTNWGFLCTFLAPTRARLEVAPPKAVSAVPWKNHVQGRPSGVRHLAAPQASALPPVRPRLGGAIFNRAAGYGRLASRTLDLGLRARGIPCAETRMRQTRGSAGTPRPTAAGFPCSFLAPTRARLEVAPPKAVPAVPWKNHAQGRPSGGAASCRAAGPRLAAGPPPVGRCDFQSRCWLRQVGIEDFGPWTSGERHSVR